MFSPWTNLARRFEQALTAISQASLARITDLRASSVFFFAYWMAQRMGADTPQSPVLLVTETTSSAIRMRQFLMAVERLVADREPYPWEYLAFPDFEPSNLFEYFETPVDVIDARNQVFDALQKNLAKVVVASYKSCWRKLLPPEAHYRQQLNLVAAGGGPQAENELSSISRDELTRWLSELGYNLTTTVINVGEFALRGGLVDVFPIGEELPVRIDLFGADIESISSFHPDTQRSDEHLSRVRILPLAPHLAHLHKPETLASLHDQWERYCREQKELMSRSAFERLSEVVQTDFELLSSGASTPRSGWYYQASMSDAQCLWHYLPAETLVLIHEEGFVESETHSYFRFWQNRFNDWMRNGLSFVNFDAVYIQPAAGILQTARDLCAGRMNHMVRGEIDSVSCPRYSCLFTSAYASPAEDGLERASVGLDSAPSSKWGTARIAETIMTYPKLTTRLPALEISAAIKVDRPITVLSQFSSRLREVLHDSGVYPEIENAILPGGFVLPVAEVEALSAAAAETARAEWTVITDVEVFGEISEVAPAPRRRYTRGAVRRSDELSPGDFIVHIDYGIGRFAQLTERHVSGITKSYVEIEYAGRDRLFVPVEQLDRLRRYSYDGAEPQLNNLGREQWKKAKEKVRHDTLELAKRLLSLYKTRQVRPGHAYVQRTVWEEEFAEGFPYQLTEDQLRAWRDVELDMESERPMERLICGDVGFGKTEIAMRAAFKACVDERQTLVLCPTTVLADQHFTTFSRRFRPFPFEVAMLSRFQSKAEQKQIVERVKAGAIDVLVATHRALSKDMDFARLGLMVVDEEQRFGVKQKESLKMRWPGVDVLAMSATPIPRTLHMSLIGLRDISLIETPPVERKPVKTYVGEFDDILVREAILRELGRGGQVYYLHNRVADIERVLHDLQYMFPDEKLLVAHGQMREDKLEEVMHAFSLGAYKIMLATTIIENGLDIPSVNTIVCDHAENLGLSQMHQLRGRVGRSAVQAFAYFFHDPSRVLTEEAQNRLHAIYNYAYLGAGYEIAQSDLRIRGAGNLLGEAQSGLARAVGFEYYCELLARSIKDVRELDSMGIEEWEDQPLITERPATQLDLPLTSFIPHEYIADPVLRLDVLRELSALQTEDAAAEFVAGLADRFGEPPDEVLNLLAVVNLRNLATRIGCERLTYNRIKHVFNLQFFEDESDWYRRAQLLDSRFSTTARSHLEFKLEFTGSETGVILHEALSELVKIKEA